MNLAVSGFRVAKKDQMHTQSQLATDAGIDYAVQQIAQDENWPGTTTPPSCTIPPCEVELHNDGQVKTTYEIAVDNPDADNKVLTAVGRAYRPVNASTPDATVKIIVNLRPVRTNNFSLVTGVGGLFLKNSAKIVGGEVQVNGEVNMQNYSQIGLSTNPLAIDVANQVCPKPPADMTDYPRLCNSGENDNPVTIQNPAHIYGNVRANYQTDNSGMSLDGLIASAGVSALPLPAHNRDAQKAAINPANDMTGAEASCSGSQTKTWPANTKITGDATLSQTCQITVQGDIWITGTLTVQNSAKLIVADSLGTTIPVIMIDAQAGATFRNSAELVSNTSSTGFEIITYWSQKVCSPDPICTDVTGTDLYNSRNQTTISLNNSAEGPETIFYARWSRVLIINSGQIGALVGQTVELRNSGTISFGTSVPGAEKTTWVINGYRRVFN